MEWKEVLLSEFLEFNPKRTIKKNEVARKITMDLLIPHSKQIYSFKYEPYTGGAKFSNGDTIMARITPCLENGKHAYVSCLNEGEIAYGSTEYIVLCGKNGVSDNEFVYYLSHTPQFVNTAIKSMVGSSGRQRAQVPVLENLIMPVPVNLSDQRKIAGILSALDAKIENNNKINANLEAQAQALFKSWFVDFTPFKDQPFVDSELGPIPQGWKVGKADDFYKINIGKTPPRKEKEWFSKNESDNKWISISDMGNCGLFISNSAEKLTNAAIKKFNISLVPVNTILLSFKLTIGRVAISDCDLTTNEAIARFILPDECYLEFSFLMLKLYNYSTLGSTSSIATAVNSKIIKSMKIVMPSQKVLEDFHTITNPLFYNPQNETFRHSRTSRLFS